MGDEVGLGLFVGVIENVGDTEKLGLAVAVSVEVGVAVGLGVDVGVGLDFAHARAPKAAIKRDAILICMLKVMEMPFKFV